MIDIFRPDSQHELLRTRLLLLPPEFLPSTELGAHGPRGSPAEPGETGPVIEVWGDWKSIVHSLHTGEYSTSASMYLYTHKYFIDNGHFQLSSYTSLKQC